MKLTHSGVFLGTEELEVVNEFKYLGVIIDIKLSFINQLYKPCENVIQKNLIPSS